MAGVLKNNLSGIESKISPEVSWLEIFENFPSAEPMYTCTHKHTYVSTYTHDH